MDNLFKPINPLRGWVQHVLPLVYDESLSYYEMLAKVKLKINELIENNKNLPNYIRKEIEEQLASDSIKEMIDEIIQSLYYNPIGSNYISLEYLATRRIRYGFEFVDYDNPTQTKSYVNEPNEPQGVCYLGKDLYTNAERVAVFYCKQYGGLNSSGYADIFTITDDRVSSTCQRVSVDQVMHANSSTKKQNEIYVSAGLYYDPSHPKADGNGNVRINKVCRINANTFGYMGGFSIDFSDWCNEVNSLYGTHYSEYDPITNPNGDMIYAGCVGYDNTKNVLYGMYGLYVFSIDENNKAHHVFKRETGTIEYAKTSQGFCVDNELFYFSINNPNVVFVYNINGTILKKYDIPFSDEDGHILRYIEDIDIDPATNDLYVSIWTGTKDSYLGKAFNRYCYLYKFNPFKNAVNSHRASESGIITDSFQIYVQQNYDRIYQKGTSGCPFTSLSEALFASRVCPFECTIIIDHNNSVEPNPNFDEYLFISGINVSFSTPNNHIRVNSFYARDSVVKFERNLEITGYNSKTNNFRALNSMVCLNGMDVTKISSSTPAIYTNGAILLSSNDITGVFNGNEYVANIINTNAQCRFNITSNDESEYNGIFELNRSTFNNDAFYTNKKHTIRVYNLSRVQFNASSDYTFGSTSGLVVCNVELTRNGTSYYYTGFGYNELISGYLPIYIPTQFGLIEVQIYHSNLKQRNIFFTPNEAYSSDTFVCTLKRIGVTQ